MHRRLDVLPPQRREDFLFDEFRLSFFDDENGALAKTEIADFLGNQRIRHIEREDRQLAFAESIRKAELSECADERVVKAALHDHADVVAPSRETFVQPMLADESTRGRYALAGLALFLRERDRWMREPPVVEWGRVCQQMPSRNRGRDVVLAGETSAQMARADPQLQHGRHARRFGKREALFDDVRHPREVRSRIEQHERRLQRIRMRAFLYDDRPFSVILADDDQHATDDARRREVRQRIGGDIRADDGLPGHRAAQRVMNRCAEHRGRRRLVGAGLYVHTELREIRLRLDEHIEKMRNGRALITADVRDARLQ